MFNVLDDGDRALLPGPLLRQPLGGLTQDLLAQLSPEEGICVLEEIIDDVNGGLGVEALLELLVVWVGVKLE